MVAARTLFQRLAAHQTGQEEQVDGHGHHLSTLAIQVDEPGVSGDAAHQTGQEEQVDGHGHHLSTPEIQVNDQGATSLARPADENSIRSMLLATGHTAAAARGARMRGGRMGQTDRQTDRLTDARQLHSPASLHQTRISCR